MNNIEKTITVYGTTFCPKCKQLTNMCDKAGVKYKYVNVEPGDVDFKMLLKENVKSFPALKIDNAFVFKSAIPEMWEEIQSAQL